MVPTAAPSRWPAWVLALGVSCLYAALALDRHRTFHTSAYDLGIFHEAISGWSHFGLPRVPLKGIHEGLGAGYDLLADHFHPILILWAPTYWIWPHPVTLLVDQALTLGLAVVPVWRYTSRALGERAAAVVATSFALAWGITTAVGFDVHEIAFAVPLIALAIERADAGRWGTATAAILTLLLVKEDLGLLVAAFGIWILLAHRQRWRRGVLLVVTGILGYWVTVHEIMPALDHGRTYMYWSYGSLGPDMPGALRHIVRHPIDTLHIAFWSGGKAKLLALTFLPVGWLAWLSPLSVLLVPLLAERLLSNREALWDIKFHYAATTVPVLVLAVVDALRRIEHPRLTRWVVGLGLAGALAVTPVFDTGLRFLLTPSGWNTTGRLAAEGAAVQVIPRAASVAADTQLVPHLIDRCGHPLCPVYLFDGPGRGAALADWVIVDVERSDYPLNSPAEARSDVEHLKQTGWQQVWAQDGYVILRR